MTAEQDNTPPSTPSSSRGPDKVDVVIAAWLLSLRSGRRVSQEELAAAIGVSVQQIQKYERAQNRISASRLYHIARYLEVSVLDFYGPLDMPLSYIDNPDWFSK